MEIRRGCHNLHILQLTFAEGGGRATCTAVAASIREDGWPHLEELSFYCPDCDSLSEVANALCAPE